MRQLVIPLLISWHCFSRTQQQIYERPRQTKAGAQNNIDGVHSSPIQTHHMLKQHIHQYTTALLPLYTIPSPHCGNQGAEVPLYSHSVRHPVESKGTPWCVGDHQRLLREVEATDSATKRIRYRISTDALARLEVITVHSQKRPEYLVFDLPSCRVFYNETIWDSAIDSSLWRDPP